MCLKELSGLCPHLAGKTKTRSQFDVQLEERRCGTGGVGLPLCLLWILQAGWVGNNGGHELLFFVSPKACWSWDLCKNLGITVSVALLEKQNRGLLFSEEAVDPKFHVYTLNISVAPLFFSSDFFSTRWNSFHSNGCQ